MKTKNLLLLVVALCAAALFPAVAHAAVDATLSWDDNSDNETAFEIERAPAAPSTAFVKVGTVGANIKTFTDANLAYKTGYQWRIRAINADTQSDYSNIASTVTPAAPITKPGNTKVNVSLTVTVPAGTSVAVLATK